MQEEFSPAHQPRRSAQKHLIVFPAHGLHSPRSMHFHWRLQSACRHRRHRRGARTRPGRLRLSHSPLEKANMQIVLAFSHDQLNIYTVLKSGIALNVRRLHLPVFIEPVYENHVMRIAHRNWSAPNFARAGHDGQFFLDLRFAHGHLKLVSRIAARGQNANLQSRSGLNVDGLFSSFRAQVGCHTPRAVAGNFRRGSVGIDQPDFRVRRGMRKYPFHAVRPHTLMPIADAAGKFGNCSRSH